MARAGDELTQLYSLVVELTEQNAINKTTIRTLKERLENVKGQSAHIGAGFPLRRFNLDITDEEFQTELERFASHLVLENQSLQFDNKQLNALLKEYETTLEQVMGKFRGVAHASQQHDLSLHSYYSSLLQTLQTAHSSAHLHDNTSLSLLLTRLSTLLRSALRSLGGEDPEVDLAGLLSEANGIGIFGDNTSSKQAPSEGSGSVSAPSPPGSPKSVKSAKSAQSTKSTAASVGTTRRPQKPPNRLTPFPGSLPGSSGGYSGTDGQSDWAMEREMEILRLEEENESLRQILAIAEESPLADLVEEELKEERADSQSPSSPPGRRKSSLTVEELEAGAEEEELARANLEEYMPGVAGGMENGAQGPGTGLGGGEGVGGGGQPGGTGAGGEEAGRGLRGGFRPKLDGALGFRPDVQDGSAIEDSPHEGGEGGEESKLDVSKAVEAADGAGAREGGAGAGETHKAGFTVPVTETGKGTENSTGSSETAAEVHVGEVVLGEGEEGKAL